MIVSVSRRTDIPAFYSEWFFNRIKEGYVYVTNPMNAKQISKIELTPDKVDCFVFWTKNAKPIMKRLKELDKFNYYFQYTITGYKNDVELGIKDKKTIIENFKELSTLIGKERVVLRYDPIFLSKEYTIEYHYKVFEKLCRELSSYTKRCVISFIDLYKKTERNTKNLGIISLTENNINKISKKFSEIAQKYNIEIETCSESYDLDRYGIKKGKCIDDRIISEVIGYELNIKKDDTQRGACGCVKSVDIGQYNTCQHNCLYCYANFSNKQVKVNIEKHNPQNPLLIGEVREDAKIKLREMKSIKGNKLGEEQVELF